MTCPNCNTPAEAVNQRFCEECGTPLTLEASAALKPGEDSLCDLHKAAANGPKCPKCGAEPDEEGFCPDCGVQCLKPAPEEGVSNLHRIEEEVDPCLALVSDIGRKHQHNEDCGTVGRGDGENAIIVVADGVSTCHHPASASAAAASIVLKTLSLVKEEDDAAAIMQQAIQLAHDTVSTFPKGEDPEADGPLTTIVAALVQGDQLTIGWVGDSRAYLIDEDVEHQLTVDDSWVEMVVAAGEMTREAASKEKLAHAVTQVLGDSDGVKVHVMSSKRQAGQTLLLCSDGLWNYLEEPGALAGAIRSCRADQQGADTPALDIASYLVQIANNKGGRDNITVGLLLPQSAPVEVEAAPIEETPTEAETEE